MRTDFLIVTAALLSITGCAAMPDETATVRAISYNIRLDTDVDGANAWPYRRDAVAALLRFYGPDLLGLQEVEAHQLAQLRDDLGDFEFVGVGRDDGGNAGEFSPIAYRRDRFSLSKHGTFWLSETPAVPSRGFDAAFPRIVTWAQLADRRSGGQLLLLNTHWDHIGTQARLESGRLIAAWLAARPAGCEPVILLGDFNAYPDADSIRVLTGAASRPLTRAHSASAEVPFGPPGTFNGFDAARAEPQPIDHIFVNAGLQVLRYGVITRQSAGRLPSDHYPVLADISLPVCHSSTAGDIR